jgi:hypothetical protein
VKGLAGWGNSVLKVATVVCTRAMVIDYVSRNVCTGSVRSCEYLGTML